jgi:hypothetical protein
MMTGMSNIPPSSIPARLTFTPTSFKPSDTKQKPMPAKSKKVVGKKTSGKEPIKKSVSRTSKSKAVSEEIADIPDLKPPEVLKHIKKVEAIIKDAEAIIKASKGMVTDPIIPSIKNFAEQAATLSRQAVQTGASALVYAWACGKLLNTVKVHLGRGAFGLWREDLILTEYLSERTSQRYMQLAKQFDDVKSLLKWSPSLRHAYIACGILPEPEARDTEEEDNDLPKTRALLSSLNGLQRNLRLFAGSTEKLGKADLTELRLVRDELNQLFNEIIPQGK